MPWVNVRNISITVGIIPEYNLTRGFPGQLRPQEIWNPPEHFNTSNRQSEDLSHIQKDKIPDSLQYFLYCKFICNMLRNIKPGKYLRDISEISQKIDWQ